MKKFFIVLGVLAFAVLWLVGKYNSFVALNEEVKEAWAQVENQYQRRIDLIPNLVQTVKGFAIQEKDVLVGVTEARAKATQTKVDINDAESFAKFQASQGELSSALSRLMVVMEAYPELKSDKNFLELQSQLEGTENRITVERKRYNEVVRKYNETILQIPAKFVAMLFGFEPKEPFSAEEGSEVAPDVDFTEEKTDSEKEVEDLKSQIEAEKLKMELEKAKQELEALKEGDKKESSQETTDESTGE